MRIHKKENTALTETTNRDNAFDNFRKDIMHVVEMYNEDMLEDDEDVFGGTEDSYAVEMLFQHLFDVLHEAIKDKYLSKDAAINTASNLTNYLADFIIKEVPYEIEKAIKTVYDKYVKVTNTNESETSLVKRFKELPYGDFKANNAIGILNDGTVFWVDSENDVYSIPCSYTELKDAMYNKEQDEWLEFSQSFDRIEDPLATRILVAIGRYSEDVLEDSETFTFSQEVLDKVNAEIEKNKPELINEIKKEFRDFKAILKDYDFTNEEINALPETKAYKDAIKDPENVWCTCSEKTESKFKPDGAVYLGVYKHGFICTKCKKYAQIG